MSHSADILLYISEKHMVAFLGNTELKGKVSVPSQTEAVWQTEDAGQTLF